MAEFGRYFTGKFYNNLTCKFSSNNFVSPWESFIYIYTFFSNKSVDGTVILEYVIAEWAVFGNNFCAYILNVSIINNSWYAYILDKFADAYKLQPKFYFFSNLCLYKSIPHRSRKFPNLFCGRISALLNFMGNYK